MIEINNLLRISPDGELYVGQYRKSRYGNIIQIVKIEDEFVDIVWLSGGDLTKTYKESISNIISHTNVITELQAILFS